MIPEVLVADTEAAAFPVKLSNSGICPHERTDSAFRGRNSGQLMNGLKDAQSGRTSH